MTCRCFPDYSLLSAGYKTKVYICQWAAGLTIHHSTLYTHTQGHPIGRWWERSVSTTRAKRDWVQKMGELVEEGEWINKSVLSASLGPAQRFKWVDVGSTISTFFSLLFSSLLFLLLSFFAFHMADSTSSPPPAPPRATEMARLQHMNACSRASRIPRAVSYFWFDCVRPPRGVNAVLLLFFSCSDVCVIMRWNPGLPTRVMTIWIRTSAPRQRGRCCNILTALVSQEGKQLRLACTLKRVKQLTVKPWKKVLWHMQEAAESNPPQQNKIIKCTQMIEWSLWDAWHGTNCTTEVSDRTATSSFQNPNVLPACCKFQWRPQNCEHAESNLWLANRCTP